MPHGLRFPVACLAAATVLAACSGNDPTVDSRLRSALASAGVEPVLAPAPEAPALVALGQRLFFDEQLSGNRNISCATCHHPVAATGDALPVSIGEGGAGLGPVREPGSGRLIPRNAPHLFNAGVPQVTSMFWDSRLVQDPVTGALATPEAGLNGTTPVMADLAAPLDSALAAQAMFPVTSTDEMRGMPGTNDIADAADNAQVWERLTERLAADPDYPAMFLAAFPTVASFDDVNFGHAARALAAFEREAFTALDSPFDRYLAGDDSALSDAEKRGALLFFGEARCGECHSGPLLTDGEHHALCVPQIGPGKVEPSEDRGRGLQTGDPADDYAFRTPQLRNVALTGPWMHDGCYTTLEAAVRHVLDASGSLAAYDASQLPAMFAATLDLDADRNDARAAALDPLLADPVALDDAQVDDLVAFLNALTDPASINLLRWIP